MLYATAKIHNKLALRRVDANAADRKSIASELTTLGNANVRAGNQTLGEMDTIESVLARSRVIAVVGLSDRPERPSHGVARYLQAQGYRIIPVNPKLTGPVLGEDSYRTLDEVPEKVDLVDIFRRSIDVPPIMEAAIRIQASAVWMQLGIVHEEAAKAARAAGIAVVMDRCTAIEHRILAREGKLSL